MASSPPRAAPADALDRDHAGDLKPWVYDTIRYGALPFFKTLFRLRVHGVENVPRVGGALVASTHRSNFDAFLLGLPLRGRYLRFMAKAELYRGPLGWVLRGAGAFRVDRGTGDAVAVQRAIDLARSGELVAIYPEGTRNRGGTRTKIHSGAARIALEAGVPMIPVAVVGTDAVRLFPPRLPRFEAAFGPAIDVSDLGDLELRWAARRLSERWQQAVAELRASLEQGRKTP
jgi:1-acyl-sn-glycerol-3-phosphate acyltransferase